MSFRYRVWSCVTATQSNAEKTATLLISCHELDRAHKSLFTTQGDRKSVINRDDTTGNKNLLIVDNQSYKKTTDDAELSYGNAHALGFYSSPDSSWATPEADDHRGTNNKLLYRQHSATDTRTSRGEREPAHRPPIGAPSAFSKSKETGFWLVEEHLPSWRLSNMAANPTEPQISSVIGTVDVGVCVVCLFFFNLTMKFKVN